MDLFQLLQENFLAPVALALLFVLLLISVPLVHYFLKRKKTRFIDNVIASNKAKQETIDKNPISTKAADDIVTKEQPKPSETITNTKIAENKKPLVASEKTPEATSKPTQQKETKKEPEKPKKEIKISEETILKAADQGNIHILLEDIKKQSS